MPNDSLYVLMRPKKGLFTRALGRNRTSDPHEPHPAWVDPELPTSNDTFKVLGPWMGHTSGYYLRSAWRYFTPVITGVLNVIIRLTTRAH